MGLSEIYTFGPTFRAENSNTTRHLAEFWMIEPEMAFCDAEDNQNLAEDFLKAWSIMPWKTVKKTWPFLTKERPRKSKAKRPNKGLNWDCWIDLTSWPTTVLKGSLILRR